MRRNRRLRAWSVPAVLLAALAGLAGCDASTADPAAQTGGPVATAAMAACPQPSPGAAGSPAKAAAGATLVPDLTLPCLAGDTSVRIRTLGQPAVINLWASWCGPCRTELPEFQQLAQSAGGQLMVLGVVTDDSRPRAASLVGDLGLTFPNLLDESSSLQRGVAPSSLPVTLFVDAAGVIRHADVSGALKLATLRTLVHDHLGVTLP